MTNTKVPSAKEILLKHFPTNEYMHPPIPVGEIPKLIEAMEFYASQHSPIVKDEWISVEERLPEKMQDILFTVVGVKNMKNEPIPPSVHYGWLDLANGFRSYIDPRDRWNATHWMPLPPAPSKGEA